MTLFRVTVDKLETVTRTSFIAEKLLERKDLQRLLREDISPLGDDLLVVAEEYGEWEDSARRVDLLCLSKHAELVVVELKRTEDGGHMELQALRYAAMVSALTLSHVIQAYAKLKGKDADSARTDVLEFLQASSEDEAALSGDVRIILAAADFSAELTTSVMWLNRHELDITCVRLTPYRLGGDLLVDVVQIIPLPEAADYEVQLRDQDREKKQAQTARKGILKRFWTQFIERSKDKTSLFSNRSATTDHWLTAGIGHGGFALTASYRKLDALAECYIRFPGDVQRTTAAFEALRVRQAEIEAGFGEVLDWQDLPERQGCRICKVLPGGWQTPESEWPELQDRMIDTLTRLEAALRKPIQELNL